MNVGTLINYLREQSERGVSHVYLNQLSRDALRSAIKAQKALAASALKGASGGAIRRNVSSPSPSSERVMRPPSLSAAPLPSSHTAPSREVVAPESINIELPAGSKEVQMGYLIETAQRWSPALSLGTLREQLVFSCGSVNSQLILVGDAPGFDEELKGTPFSGRAGMKLDAILNAMGTNREHLYITNICKFRPSLPGQTVNNRKPTTEELASCMPLFKKELEIIKPQCIVALGATAAEALTGQAHCSAGKMRGEWLEFLGIPLRVTYHPSYLLRNEENISEKRKLWEDMLSVMEKLNMPISEKQRGYFMK